MIPLNRQPLRFTPSWLDEADAPVFLVRPAELNERDAFEAELDAPPYNAGVVYRWTEHQALSDAAKAWLTEDDGLARMNEALSKWLIGAMDAEDAAWVQKLREGAEQSYEPYIKLARQGSRRSHVLPTLAAKTFLIGWENRLDENGEAVPFTTSFGRATDDTIRSIDPYTLKWLGSEIYAAMYLSAEERKNFGQGSKSEPNQKPTPSDTTPRKARTAGRSTKRSGRGTPRSR